MKMLRISALALLALGSVGLAAQKDSADRLPATRSAAAVKPRPQDTKARDWTDELKDALVVHDNKEDIVRKVRFSLRQQFQVAAVQPNGSNGLHLKDGASPVNQEFRRSWLGVTVDFAGGTQFHTWARVGGLPVRETYRDGRTRRNFSYAGIYNIYLRQEIAALEGLSVKAGKVSPLFSSEYITSSANMLCMERSVLCNQFGFDSNWGVELNYEPNRQDRVFFQLLANDRASASKSPSHPDAYRDGRGLKGEFGWEDKCYAIIGASHTFAESGHGWHRVSAQYAHDFNNVYHGRRKPGANHYGIGVKDALSLGYDMKHGQLAFMANLVAAFETMGGQGSNNVGLVLQPSWRLNEHVELVCRYTGMLGDGACKLGADRYIGTQTTAPAWVDSLHAFYLGADFYASPHNPHAAKLMIGAEYVTARAGGTNAYNGWEFSSAIRFNF